MDVDAFEETSNKAKKFVLCNNFLQSWYFKIVFHFKNI